MRFAAREVTDDDHLRSILDGCTHANVGLVGPDGKPYVVPLSFGYHWGKDPVLFFHSANAGRKVEAITHNQSACATFVKTSELIPAPEGNPCGASMRFESLIAEGEIEVITDPEEKNQALAAIMSHYKQPTGPFKDAVLAKTNVYRLVAKNLCGKCRK